MDQACEHGDGEEATHFAAASGGSRRRGGIRRCMSEHPQPAVLKRAVPKAAPKPRVVNTSARKVVMLPRQGDAPQPALADAQGDWSEF